MSITSVPHTRLALSLANEYSDAVAGERLYYKFTAFAKVSMFHPAHDPCVIRQRRSVWNR